MTTTKSKAIAIVAVLWSLALPAPVHGFSCSPLKYCTAMENCAEAVFFLRDCGHKARDRDNDGIPCEKLCGKTKEIMAKRLNAQTATIGSALLSSPSIPFSCAPKKSCGQMVSCEEARFQLKQCGNTKLDGNGDGIPCNALCR